MRCPRHKRIPELARAWEGDGATRFPFLKDRLLGSRSRCKLFSQLFFRRHFFGQPYLVAPGRGCIENISAGSRTRLRSAIGPKFRRSRPAGRRERGRLPSGGKMKGEPEGRLPLMKIRRLFLAAVPRALVIGSGAGLLFSSAAFHLRAAAGFPAAAGFRMPAAALPGVHSAF